MQPALSAMTPQRIATESFTDAGAAVDRLIEIYERNTGFLRDRFEAYINGEARSTRVRATYPCASIHAAHTVSSLDLAFTRPP
jgi:AMP nucleosidase